MKPDKKLKVDKRLKATLKEAGITVEELGEELKKYNHLMERLEALLTEEDPPVSAVMSACNTIMCHIIKKGEYTRDDAVLMIDTTLGPDHERTRLQ